MSEWMEKSEAVEFAVKLSWTCRSLVKQLPLLPPCHYLYNASASYIQIWKWNLSAAMRNIKQEYDFTFKSLKKIVLRAQSTCENRFWSKTLHMSSNRSTSHWLYVWLWSNENNDDCHSRSSTDATNERIIGETLRDE